MVDQDWIGPMIFKNFADQDWTRFNFIGSGLDSDWKFSQSAHLCNRGGHGSGVAESTPAEFFVFLSDPDPGSKNFEIPEPVSKILEHERSRSLKSDSSHVCHAVEIQQCFYLRNDMHKNHADSCYWQKMTNDSGAGFVFSQNYGRGSGVKQNFWLAEFPISRHVRQWCALVIFVESESQALRVRVI